MCSLQAPRTALPVAVICSDCSDCSDCGVGAVTTGETGSGICAVPFQRLWVVGLLASCCQKGAEVYAYRSKVTILHALTG